MGLRSRLKKKIKGTLEGWGLWLRLSTMKRTILDAPSLIWLLETHCGEGERLKEQKMSTTQEEDSNPAPTTEGKSSKGEPEADYWSRSGWRGRRLVENQPQELV